MERIKLPPLALIPSHVHQTDGAASQFSPYRHTMPCDLPANIIVAACSMSAGVHGLEPVIEGEGDFIKIYMHSHNFKNASPPSLYTLPLYLPHLPISYSLTTHSPLLCFSPPPTHVQPHVSPAQSTRVNATNTNNYPPPTTHRPFSATVAFPSGAGHAQMCTGIYGWGGANSIPTYFPPLPVPFTLAYGCPFPPPHT